jgi:hypothetical protein
MRKCRGKRPKRFLPVREPNFFSIYLFSFYFTFFQKINAPVRSLCANRLNATDWRCRTDTTTAHCARHHSSVLQRLSSTRGQRARRAPGLVRHRHEALGHAAAQLSRRRQRLLARRLSTSRLNFNMDLLWSTLTARLAETPYTPSPSLRLPLSSSLSFSGTSACA